MDRGNIFLSDFYIQEAYTKEVITRKFKHPGEGKADVDYFKNGEKAFYFPTVVNFWNEWGSIIGKITID